MLPDKMAKSIIQHLIEVVDTASPEHLPINFRAALEESQNYWSHGLVKGTRHKPKAGKAKAQPWAGPQAEKPKAEKPKAKIPTGTKGIITSKEVSEKTGAQRGTFRTFIARGWLVKADPQIKNKPRYDQAVFEHHLADMLKYMKGRQAEKAAKNTPRGILSPENARLDPHKVIPKSDPSDPDPTPQSDPDLPLRG